VTEICAHPEIQYSTILAHITPV